MPAHRRLRLTLILLAACAMGVVLLAGGAWLAATREPAWWPAADPGAYAGELGAQFENAVVSQMSLARPAASGQAPGAPYRSEPWRVALSERDLSAWAATRLRPWLETNDPSFRWPSGVGTPRVRVADGVLRVGVPLDDARAVLTLDCEVRVDDTGDLRVRVRDAALGSLPLPVDAALARLGVLPPEVSRILRGEAPLPATTPVDGTRVVRLLGVEARDGALEIEARTEAKR